MAVNRVTAKIIFQHIYRSFGFDQEAERWQIKAKRVTPDVLANIQSSAANKGERINIEDVEYLLQGTVKQMYSSADVTYLLSWDSILCGETFRFTFTNNNVRQRITVMKVSSTEALLLDDSERSNSDIYVNVINDQSFYLGTAMPLYGYEHCKVEGIESISPHWYYHYLDDFLVEKRHRYTVADNIWECYNKTKEFVEVKGNQQQFRGLLNTYTAAGLSTFHLRLLIDILT